MNQPVVSTYVEYGKVYKVRLLSASVRQLCPPCIFSWYFFEKFTQTPTERVTSMYTNDFHSILIQSRAPSLINSSVTALFLGKQS